MSPRDQRALGIYMSSTGGPATKQIQRRIRLRIALGAVDEGERLPSAEQLGKVLGIAENTVRSAYLALMRERVLETDPSEPSFGTRVAVGARSSALLRHVVRDELAEPVALIHSLDVPQSILEETFYTVMVDRYDKKKKAKK